MEQAFQLLPGSNPNQLKLEYFCQLNWNESRALAPSCKAGLPVAFGSIPVKFPLENEKGMKFGKDTLDLQILLPLIHKKGDDNRWSLSKGFPFVFFDVSHLRLAYCLLRSISTQVENSAIEMLPVAPFHGFTQSFDITLDVPKEVSQHERQRRSLLIRTPR